MESITIEMDLRGYDLEDFESELDKIISIKTKLKILGIELIVKIIRGEKQS